MSLGIFLQAAILETFEIVKILMIGAGASGGILYWHCRTDPDLVPYLDWRTAGSSFFLFGDLRRIKSNGFRALAYGLRPVWYFLLAWSVGAFATTTVNGLVE